MSGLAFDDASEIVRHHIVAKLNEFPWPMYRVTQVRKLQEVLARVGFAGSCWRSRA